MALVLRRRADGGIHVVGELPAQHAFALGFIERGLADGYIEVQVAMRMAGGSAVYRLTGFADDDGDRNPTAWRCELVSGPDGGGEGGGVSGG